MHEEIFRALEDGATVITAGAHLARAMAREFHTGEAGRGHTVWNRPDVLPFDALLHRAWKEWLASWAGPETGGDTPILLDTLQEQILWEKIVRASPAGESLLQ